MTGESNHKNPVSYVCEIGYGSTYCVHFCAGDPCKIHIGPESRAGLYDLLQVRPIV